MKKFSMILALGFTALIVSACGDKSSSAPATAAANSCAAGSGYSAQYNTCLPQSFCPVGQGLYNNQCVAVTTTPATGYNGYNGTYNPGAPVNNCAAGQGYSAQYNTCLAQGSCAVGQGAYVVNNVTTCVAVTVNTGYNTGYNTGVNYNGNYYNGGNVNNGGCPQNMAYTVYGCLSQGPCNYGQVFYNNQCYNLVQPYQGGFGFQFRIGRRR